MILASWPHGPPYSATCQAVLNSAWTRVMHTTGETPTWVARFLQFCGQSWSNRFVMSSGSGIWVSNFSPSSLKNYIMGRTSTVWRNRKTLPIAGPPATHGTHKIYCKWRKALLYKVDAIIRQFQSILYCQETTSIWSKKDFIFDFKNINVDDALKKFD